MSDSPQPVVSRRLAGGSPGARGLLFTVLGELLLPTGGAAWTAALIDVFGRFGIEEKATRQAILRTAAAGWLRTERHGRRTRWQLTDAATALLAEGARRIYGFTGSEPVWDGRWLIVLARVPETDRRTRHLLRSRLAWAGLGALAPGLWISPRPDRLPEVRGVLAGAGVADAHCFLAAHELGDARAMVDSAWDVPAIAAAYVDFVAQCDEPADDPLAAQVDLVHRWRRFPQIDPALPRSLLPEPWPGDAAAALFTRRHEQLRAPALRAWRELAVP